jgi:anti-sigma regulatory factor (Ser/Thr protein kinase)
VVWGDPNDTASAHHSASQAFHRGACGVPIPVCRVASTEFEPVQSAVTAARHWVADHLERWELQELTGTATLLSSELVTNAVVHATSSSVVSMAVADGILEIGVSDRDPRLPHRAGISGPRSTEVEEPTSPAGGRLGLVLVAELADEWGIARLAEGKQVWFRLNATNWSYRTACRCHTDHIDRVRLESGRYALAIPGPWENPVPPSTG